MTIAETETEGDFKLYAIEKYHANEEPFYLPISDEVELFEAAFNQRIPVLLKGPTGVGKTRFVEYMAWRMGRPLTITKKGSDGEETSEALPLVTVACHEEARARGRLEHPPRDIPAARGSDRRESRKLGRDAAWFPRIQAKADPCDPAVRQRGQPTPAVVLAG